MLESCRSFKEVTKYVDYPEIFIIKSELLSYFLLGQTTSPVATCLGPGILVRLYCVHDNIGWRLLPLLLSDVAGFPVDAPTKWWAYAHWISWYRHPNLPQCQQRHPWISDDLITGSSLCTCLQSSGPGIAIAMFILFFPAIDLVYRYSLDPVVLITV
jgi:hypothetical protein